ncbi:MAG: hypothetical protein RJB38_1171 [Pseudomonadota bacterium]|jgi:hypothetical protein
MIRKVQALRVALWNPSIRQSDRPYRKLTAWGVGAIFCLGLSVGSLGCKTAYRRSVGATQEQVFTRIFLTDTTTAWIAVMESLKSFRLDVSNQKAGFVQTRWIDNTVDRNNADPMGGTGPYLKAQFRFKINLSPGYLGGRGQGVKVSVLREQWVQRDILEGWRPSETDAIEERTLLYRIGRIIAVRMEVERLEREKTERAIEESPF